MLAILRYDDELTLVDLFLDDIVRVDLELLADHLPRGHGAHRTATVDADQEEVIQVNLVALRKLVYAHRVATFHGHGKAHILSTAEVFLDELRKQERPAVERACRLCNLGRVGDQCRYGVVDINTFLDRQHAVDDVIFQGKLEEPGHCAAAFRHLGDIGVCCPGVYHISLSYHLTAPP